MGLLHSRRLAAALGDGVHTVPSASRTQIRCITSPPPFLVRHGDKALLSAPKGGSAGDRWRSARSTLRVQDPSAPSGRRSTCRGMGNLRPREHARSGRHNEPVAARSGSRADTQTGTSDCNAAVKRLLRKFSEIQAKVPHRQSWERCAHTLTSNSRSEYEPTPTLAIGEQRANRPASAPCASTTHPASPLPT